MMLVLNLIVNKEVGTPLGKDMSDGGERGKFLASLALDVSPRNMRDAPRASTWWEYRFCNLHPREEMIMRIAEEFCLGHMKLYEGVDLTLIWMCGSPC